MDRRDLLLDQLSELGQTSVTDNGDGSVSRHVRRRRATPLVDAAGFHYRRRPARPNSGGRLGALQSLSNVPGGELDSYRHRARRGRHLARRTPSTRVYDRAGDGTTFFTATGPYPAGDLGSPRA